MEETTALCHGHVAYLWYGQGLHGEEHLSGESTPAGGHGEGGRLTAAENRPDFCTDSVLYLKTSVFLLGKSFDPVPLLNNAVSNIICQIVFGRRFDYSDQDLQSMLRNLTDMAYLEGSIWALVRYRESCRVYGNDKK